MSAIVSGDMAPNIEGAKYFELPGVSHLVWVAGIDRAADEIKRVLPAAEPTSEPDRVPAAFINADINNSSCHAMVLGERRAAGYPS